MTQSSSTPVGPIVGGVIGGIAFLVIVGFLVWRFYFRKRRNTVELWNPPEKRDQSTLHRSNRQSTRSTHSIASTVLTRASNVIQIAYIPGVTTRTPPESPGLIVPPVPALPGASANTSASPSPQVEQHFFMPRDLRDSTWSDTSSVDPRISLAPSLARASVATTIYGRDAIVPPVPAQQAFRAQANVVSVKNGSGTPSPRPPPVPQLPANLEKSSLVARAVHARPIEVKKTNSGPRVPTLGNLAAEANKKPSSTTSEKSPSAYSDEKEVVVSKVTEVDDAMTPPLQAPQPTFAKVDTARSSGVSSIIPSNSPLSSANSQPTHRHTGSQDLNALIEDALIRAARDPQHMGLGSPRPEHSKQDSGPFSDANEVKDS